ncbi:peptidoglycan-binding protein [Cocleimonas sp. KMM 6892]|uniref:peptidoglycan-binding protein n=1 Tax=unclassified Cocleimonas TaxID=2639732 RepID=UPI002DB7AA59|nr:MULTISPECIES: peptidoglycan-binding protein [unclassified Cocleimonas]MEB8432199.1 peptidoglycan-binding protein [Cocleimonas sp. KMM 6892]MEC4714715.1 peptidoglycan-binding protein [Cocleimonas sp. KMM 6895]MEC4744471.1 peptidoglycan-binding protein [Cocleimonas sp. KMM 6896]
MTTQLSVSSVILAAVLSGCSQQQVIGGSQVVNGSSQQNEGGSQVAGSSQAGGSQQQVEATAPVVMAKPVAPAAKRAPVRVYQPKLPAPRRVYSRGPAPRPAHSVKRSGMGLPPAKPGQCFAKVKTPAKYITKQRKVLIQKATSKRVLVRAPQYRWINKRVLVRKATYQNRHIPAQYRTQNNRVMVKPAYNTWRKGHGAITRIDNMTGEIMCRVTVPAQYKTVSKRVLVRKAQTIRKMIPAVYKTVKQKQRVSGAIYKTVNRPARYTTQNYRVKVAGARYVWRPILCKTNAPKNYRHAAVKRKPVVRPKAMHKTQYKRPAQGITHQQYLKVMNAPMPSKAAPKKRMPRKVISKKVKTAPMTKAVTKPAATMTKPVAKAPAKAAGTTEKPSKTAIKQNIVYGIQAALKSKGYNPGKLDGKMGPSTAAALKAFQSSRGLPVGVLSKDTFRALGLVR